MSQCDRKLLEPYLSMIAGARGLFRKRNEGSAHFCAPLAYLQTSGCLHHDADACCAVNPYAWHDDLMACACSSSPQEHFYERQREICDRKSSYKCFCRVHCLRCHQRLSRRAANRHVL